MRVRKLSLTLAAAAAVAAAGMVVAQDQEPIQPIAPPAQINLGLVELGKKLYFDPRLSKSGFISCNSCHNLSMGGTDNIPTSIGDKWQQGPINAPTVLNSSLNVAQFWDGRAADVEEQAKGPILNPIEMGMPDSAAVLVHLRESPAYVTAFRAAFPGERDPISYDNVGRAIGAFERGLVTPSPWDRFLAGDSTALTTDQRKGLRAFLNAG